MQVLKVGQIWKYDGNSIRAENTDYRIVEILPAVKGPMGGWHKGIRYKPLTSVPGAANDYTRIESDFLEHFRFERHEA